MQLDEARAVIRSIVEDPALTYRQRMHRLAGAAEDLLEYPALPDDAAAALDKRVVCDLHEGPAPHRPRYALPDYGRVLTNGSAYLELAPATTLDDALATLLILYTQVPSITGYPVYVGDWDDLLAPFVTDVDDEHLTASLRRFWVSMDRMLPDAFTHGDLGPDDSRVTRTVLALERELRQVVPNLTLKVDPGRTPDDLLVDAVRTVFDTGKPHFVNHPMMVRDLGERYAAVSCYNSLLVGGGAHTLVRLNLAAAADEHGGSADAFIRDALPRWVERTAAVIEARVRYLVEEACFFEHSWLVREGLLDPSRFTAMFGVFGLAECVDGLLFGARYGRDEAANDLGLRITRRLAELVADRPVPHCAGSRCALHAQAGIETDVGATAGTRIPVGDEPPLLDHLRCVTPHHALFPAGISDVLHFDDTARRNPQAIVDVIRGAFTTGMRDFTFNLDSNDFIRITGYLVRKSDLAGIDEGARHGSTFLGAGSVHTGHVDQRSPKRVGCDELEPRPGR
ncbi:MAG TPA: YjjI family glycine radical enzyme [Acidimicrobiales bacterium]|nr:YjjI family glycine radical enzyme [Acidimicrobiales bacterium]